MMVSFFKTEITRLYRLYSLTLKNSHGALQPKAYYENRFSNQGVSARTNSRRGRIPTPVVQYPLRKALSSAVIFANTFPMDSDLLTVYH